MTTLQRFTYTAVVALLLAGSALLSGALSPPQAPDHQGQTWPRQVLLMRHAEKDLDTSGIHINKAGKQRAEKLHELFEVSKERPNPFPKPDFIFAAAKGNDSHRPVETLTPLATRLNLPLNQAFESKQPGAGKKDSKDNSAKASGMVRLRDELFSDAKYSGKTVLIAWRHSSISDLARLLKASKAPARWADNVFDRIWYITYDDTGKATLADLPQCLMPGDAKK